MAHAAASGVQSANPDQWDDKQTVSEERHEDKGAENRQAAARPLDEDDLLLRLVAQNSEAAFRVLVERHVDRSYALALRLLGNVADAEDVAQDVMLRIWSTRGRWQEGKARFTTWLYRVITNRCIDLRRRPRTEDMDKAPDMADDKPDALSMVHRDEIKTLLECAMQQLPEQQRTALILSYTDDLSNPEVAEIMDKSVSSVESLLKRGRQNLRELLRKSEGTIVDSFTKD
ncbi:MAG: RNA polymerase sigma factor [Alphaproteobacteria bacterium]|nr:RNA polymerase sigma factor [Alphaproteobacteria bacterium]